MSILRQHFWEFLKKIQRTAWFCWMIIFLGAACRESIPKVAQEVQVYSRDLVQVGHSRIREDELRLRLHLEIRILPKEITSRYRDGFKNKDNPLHEIYTRVLDKMIEDAVILEYGENRGLLPDSAELTFALEKEESRIGKTTLENLLAELNIPLARWKAIVTQQFYVRRIIDAEIGSKLTVTLNEVQGYYAKHRNEFQTEERIKIRHIVTDSLEKAEEIHKRILAGENFAQLAINHSISPERASGGVLGYFEKGAFPAIFDKAFDLERGQISPVVKSEYGYHIFKLLDRKPKGYRPLEDVTDLIYEKIFEQKLKTHYAPWIEGIRKEIPVKIYDEVLDTFIL